MDAFGYRLLAGRDGAQGYACGGDGQTVTARGLHAGKTYTLYCVTPGGAREHARRTADASGMARFTLSGAQPVFLALDGRPVLWEDDRAEDRYCQACDLLRAQARMLEAAQRQAREKAAAYQEAAERPEAPKETAQAETAAATSEPTGAELEAGNETPEEAPKETARAETAAATSEPTKAELEAGNETPEEAPKETAQAETAAAPYEPTEAELEAGNETPEEAPKETARAETAAAPYEPTEAELEAGNETPEEAPKETVQAETAAAPYELTEAELEADNKTPEEAEAPAGTQEELREPAQPKLRQGTGEAVDALPRLIWPKEAAELKPYFDTQPPIRPFDAPGWRFVRVPSPIRSVGYCAVGMYASDCRVRQVAYAVPGTPHHAPAFLPGYRYQPGMDGKGYWTLWRRL